MFVSSVKFTDAPEPCRLSRSRKDAPLIQLPSHRRTFRAALLPGHHCSVGYQMLPDPVKIVSARAKSFLFLSHFVDSWSPFDFEQGNVTYRRHIISRLSSAVIEGLKNKIKVLKRMGYNYTNQVSFMRKILQRCGYLNHLSINNSQNFNQTCR